MSEHVDPDWTDPQFCPYCGSENLAENDEWYQRDDNDYDTEADDLQAYRLHGENVCDDCGGQFETRSKPRTYRETNPTWTFQFVPEDIDGNDAESISDLQAIRLIEADEDSFSVTAERAKWNMLFGGCGEVQGPDYAIQDLYDFASEHADIDAEPESFEAGEWIAEMMERNDDAA